MGIITFMPVKVSPIDFGESSDDCIAIYRTLVAHSLERTSIEAPTLRFQATGDAAAFGRLARRFLGPEVANVEKLA
jgi:glutamate racemase